MSYSKIEPEQQGWLVTVQSWALFLGGYIFFDWVELSLVPDIVDIQGALLLVSEVSSLTASSPGPEVHLMLKHVTLEQFKIFSKIHPWVWILVQIGLPQNFSVNPGPLGPYWVFKLIGVWLRLGLGSLGTKGFWTWQSWWCIMTSLLTWSGS